MSRLARWKFWQGVPRAVWALRDGLQRRGFQAIGEDYDERHFGNAIIDLERDGCRVRVVKDRGQWMTSVHAGGQWFHTEAWYGLIRGGLPSTTRLMTPEEQSEFLLSEINEICARVGDADSVRALEVWLRRWNAEGERERWRRAGGEDL